MEIIHQVFEYVRYLSCLKEIVFSRNIIGVAYNFWDALLDLHAHRLHDSLG